MSVIVEYAQIRLAPCPFCGKNNQFMTKESSNLFDEYGNRCEFFEVVCHHCGARTRSYSSIYEDGIKIAQNKWKERA